MGGDSAATDSDTIVTVTNPKVFKNGPFLIGYCNSFRMGQLLQYKFIPPKQGEEPDISYIVTSFTDTVKKCLEDNSFDEKEEGINFLIGYKGNLYIMEPSFQILVSTNNFNAIGSGSDLALGALYATSKQKPRKRIQIALEAASKFNNRVAPPFIVIRGKI